MIFKKKQFSTSAENCKCKESQNKFVKIITNMKEFKRLISPPLIPVLYPLKVSSSYFCIGNGLICSVILKIENLRKY